MSKAAFFLVSPIKHPKGMIYVMISTGVALRTTALAFSAALFLAACSSGSGSGSSSSGTSSSTAGAAKAGSGTQVTVTETEYSLKLSRNSFTPGTYTFTADNAGKVTHALEIDGPGVSDVKTKNLQGGGMAALTVTLKKGTYELYCPVPGHKQLGMDTHIKVS